MSSKFDNGKVIDVNCLTWRDYVLILVASLVGVNGILKLIHQYAYDEFSWSSVGVLIAVILMIGYVIKKLK